MHHIIYCLVPLRHVQYAFGAVTHMVGTGKKLVVCYHLIDADTYETLLTVYRQTNCYQCKLK